LFDNGIEIAMQIPNGGGVITGDAAVALADVFILSVADALDAASGQSTIVRRQFTIDAPFSLPIPVGNRTTLRDGQ
jgi:hypothetical protein